MAAATQAFENDGLAPFARIDCAGHTTSQGTGHGATKRIAVVVEFAKQCTGTGAQYRRPGGFLIELPLVAGQRLARGEVALERGRWGAIQNGGVVCPAVGAGGEQQGSGSDCRDRGFHLSTFICPK